MDGLKRAALLVYYGVAGFAILAMIVVSTA